MVLISSQHFTEADTAVPFGQAAFINKGTQLYFGIKFGKYPFYSKCHNDWLICVESFGNFDNCAKSVDT